MDVAFTIIELTRCIMMILGRLKLFDFVGTLSYSIVITVDHISSIHLPSIDSRFALIQNPIASTPVSAYDDS